MHWIMIIWMFSGYGPEAGVALDHVNFKTKDSCDLAARKILQNKGQSLRPIIRITCVSDGLPDGTK